MAYSNQMTNMTSGEGAASGLNTQKGPATDSLLEFEQGLLSLDKSLADLREDKKRKKERGSPTEKYVKELQKDIEVSDKVLQDQMTMLNEDMKRDKNLFVEIEKG